MRLEQVPENYDRAAAWYDALTEVVFGRLLGVERHRERAVDLLGPLEGARVLDVGCGTGRSFPLLAPRVGREGTVVGLDYSRGMLGRARRRIADAGWPQVGLVRGDAATLAGLRGPFDAVLSVWCLGIVHDLEGALQAALDVLRPGGTMAIVDFRRVRPEDGPLRWTFPLWSRLLRAAGTDTAEDLDDARLRARWRRGRAILGRGLTGIRETSYLQGTGFVLAGRKRAGGSVDRRGLSAYRVLPPDSGRLVSRRFPVAPHDPETAPSPTHRLAGDGRLGPGPGLRLPPARRPAGKTLRRRRRLPPPARGGVR